MIQNGISAGIFFKDPIKLQCNDHHEMVGTHATLHRRDHPVAAEYQNRQSSSQTQIGCAGNSFEAKERHYKITDPDHHAVENKKRFIFQTADAFNSFPHSNQQVRNAHEYFCVADPAFQKYEKYHTPNDQDYSNNQPPTLHRKIISYVRQLSRKKTTYHIRLQNDHRKRQ